MQRREVRVHGPYKHRRKWRIVVVGESGGQTHHLCETKEEALAAIHQIEDRLSDEKPCTIADAIRDYEKYRRELGRKETSWSATTYRLNRLFALALDSPIRRITAERAQGLYDTLRAPDEKGKVLAADSHRNMLAEAKTFLNWVVKTGLAKVNALAGVEGKGLRRHGKPQLRIDEVRKWLGKALEYAQDEEGASAALLALVMGMRASEIVNLQARDLDDEGKLLWITRSKTAAGRRTLEVPDLIRSFLVQAAKGRLPTAPLLGYHRREWVNEWVHRLCEKAGVEDVCAHSMRGLHGTLGMSASSTPHLVAASLGHESARTTMESYADGEIVEKAQKERAMRVITGGKK